MKLRLPDSISSSQDLVAVLLELHDYAKWFSHNAVKERVHAKHASLPPTLSPAALDLVRQASTKALLNQKQLDDLVQSLEQYKNTATKVTITLAAPPTADIKKTLVAWCRAHIAPDVLISFQFNATLLGGMVIRSGSHIFDWSFRRQILQAKDTFPEVLRRV